MPEFGKIRIKQAQTAGEIGMVRTLFMEYRTFLDVDLCFQSFQHELDSLPGEYSPPDGELLIALEGDIAAGCVAVRKFEERVCEMKRLFVRPGARGRGLGRELSKRIIDIARELGYRQMRLDTLDRLTAAMKLYESLGFRRIEPYYDNPLSGVVYWELNLNDPDSKSQGA